MAREYIGGVWSLGGLRALNCFFEPERSSPAER
jgi:hypothetical protein